MYSHLVLLELSILHTEPTCNVTLVAHEGIMQCRIDHDIMKVIFCFTLFDWQVSTSLSKSAAKPTKSPFKTSMHTDLDRAKGRNSVLKEKLAGAQEEKKVMEHSNHELNKQLTWAHTRCDMRKNYWIQVS